MNISKVMMLGILCTTFLTQGVREKKSNNKALEIRDQVHNNLKMVIENKKKENLLKREQEEKERKKQDELKEKLLKEKLELEKLEKQKKLEDKKFRQALNDGGLEFFIEYFNEYAKSKNNSLRIAFTKQGKYKTWHEKSETKTKGVVVIDSFAIGSAIFMKLYNNEDVEDEEVLTFYTDARDSIMSRVQKKKELLKSREEARQQVACCYSFFCCLPYGVKTALDTFNNPNYFKNMHKYFYDNWTNSANEDESNE